MKKAIQFVFSLIVIAIGAYLLLNHSWLTPFSLTGLGFVLVGYLHFMPFCPFCRIFCKE